MYVTEVKSEKKGKLYCSTLVRESYREAGGVKNKTVANISNLPKALIQNIKNFLQDKKGDFNISDLGTGKAYEFGGAYVLREIAKDIGLDKTIFYQKTQWRENVLAMITGRLLYQGSKLNLINTYKDTALWEIAGHEFGERLDVEQNCYKPMDELLKRKDKIERKLGRRHLSKGSITLYDIVI